ncbi:hypothetical protein BDN70DRAFT_888538 [Pholiota conissans]|uniref:Uncharacterized protein n=1 Tax=Pholiota conissans TaxID=109636 RepID=A0A9P6CRC8_9AGAR|nr:hypothetical protein BDN70DRAFT_888538 [Pholiota conissans]
MPTLESGSKRKDSARIIREVWSKVIGMRRDESVGLSIELKRLIPPSGLRQPSTLGQSSLQFTIIQWRVIILIIFKRVDTTMRQSTYDAQHSTRMMMLNPHHVWCAFAHLSHHSLAYLAYLYIDAPLRPRVLNRPLSPIGQLISALFPSRPASSTNAQISTRSMPCYTVDDEICKL